MGYEPYGQMYKLMEALCAWNQLEWCQFRENWAVWERNGPNDISQVLGPDLPPGLFNDLIYLNWIIITCNQYVQQNSILKQYTVICQRDKVTKNCMGKIPQRVTVNYSNKMVINLSNYSLWETRVTSQNYDPKSAVLTYNHPIAHFALHWHYEGQCKIKITVQLWR